MNALRRVSRGARNCGSCGGWIRRGDTYLVHVDFPGSDAGYADHAGHPVQLPECADCAARYGRAALLGRPT